MFQCQILKIIFAFIAKLATIEKKLIFIAYSLYQTYYTDSILVFRNYPGVVTL